MTQMTSRVLQILHSSVDGEVEQRRPQEMQRRLGLRLIDILAAPGPPPIFQRGEDSQRGEARRNAVGVGKDSVTTSAQPAKSRITALPFSLERSSVMPSLPALTS